MRTLAIDYGESRTGFAISDALNITAQGLETVYNYGNDKILLKKIDELLEKYNGTYEIINKIDPFMSDKNNVKLSDFITEASFLDSKNRYILGAGPNNAHKADEYITVDSLEELERQYLDIIKMI